MSDPVRVLIADDHPVFRDGLASLLGTQPDVAVVATAADGAEAVALAAEHRPDVVVMDLRMRRTSGIDATAELRRRADTPPVLVLTTFDDDDLLSGALRAGAAGGRADDLGPAAELLGPLPDRP